MKNLTNMCIYASESERERVCRLCLHVKNLTNMRICAFEIERVCRLCPHVKKLANMCILRVPDQSGVPQA